MVRIHTFSTLDLVDGEREELQALLKQPKRLALLVFLAASRSGTFHRRDSLLPIFWPELDEQKARHALSQTLHVLRSALGDGVIVTRGDEEVGLDPELYWCDAPAFEALVEQGKLGKALDLYRGDFLVGFHLGDSSLFMNWLEQERGRLRRLSSQAAEGLCEREVKSGNTAAAVPWARRALELAPYDEERFRRLVGLLDQLGKRAEAIATYESFAALLAREFDLEPSPETQLALEDIRRRTEPSPSTHPEPDKSLRPHQGPAIREEGVGHPPHDPQGPLKASGSRKRTPRTLAWVAGTLIVVTLFGLTVSYWNASNQFFIRVATRTMVRVSSSGVETTSFFHGINLFQGSIGGGWIDERLGFPRFIEEIDVDLDWIRFEEHEALRAGLPLPAGTEAEEELMKKMMPDRRVAWLVMTGREEEAVVEAQALFADSGASYATRLDSLTAFLGYSGVSDFDLIQTATAHGFRPSAETRFPSFQVNHAIGALLEPLANLDQKDQRAILEPFLAQSGPVGLDALWLATMLRWEDVRGIGADLLFSTEETERLHGFGSLLAFGDCRDMGMVADALADSPRILTIALYRLFFMGAKCGAGQGLVEPLADIPNIQVRANLLRGRLALDAHGVLGELDHHLQPPSQASGVVWAVPEWFILLEALEGIPKSEMAPLLEVRLKDPDPQAAALAGALWAQWGSEEALGPILGVINDEVMDNMSRDLAIEALKWFSGEPVEAALDSLLASNLPPRRRRAAFSALSWKDPSFAVPRLLRGLEDPDSAVRSICRQVLLSLDSEVSIPLLEAAIEDSPKNTRIQILNTLQRMSDRRYPRSFRAHLEEEDGTAEDISAGYWASGGLYRAYLGLPPSEVLEALDSPSRDVRNAAMLALAEHPSRQEARDSLITILADPGHELRTRASLALWTMNLIGRLHSVLDLGYDAIRRGDVPEVFVHQWRTRNGLPVWIHSLLGTFLSGKHNLLPPINWSQRHTELIFAMWLSSGYSNPGSTKRLVEYLRQEPSRVPDILEDELYQPLKDFFAFRVMTGLEDPISVDEIVWPETDETGSGGSGRN